MLGEQEKTRLYVLRFKIRILAENRLGGVPRCKHPQDVLHRDAHIANNQFAAEYVGAHVNSFEQVSISRHVSSIAGSSGAELLMWGFGCSVPEPSEHVRSAVSGIDPHDLL